MKIKVGDLVRDKRNGGIGFVYEVDLSERAWIFWTDSDAGEYWLEGLLSVVEILQQKACQ